MIFRRGAHHGRAADIDIVDRIVVGAVGAAHGGGERIEIDRQQIDGLDGVLAHHRLIEAAPAQQAAVNLRMQGLDAAAHDFRKAGVLGDFLDRDAVAGQQSLAVPPVDSSSMPRSFSSRANSTMPVLSETLSNARRTGVSTGLLADAELFEFLAQCAAIDAREWSPRGSDCPARGPSPL